MIIGIDLGTTNSAVAVYENGRAVMIPNRQGERTIPSVFQVKPNGEEVVGQAARKSAPSLPHHTVMEVKRLIGTEEVVTLGEKTYRPEEISSKILRELRQSAEDYLNTNVEEAVITVPAYFTDAQRKATRDAGILAGLKVERIINEPTAAALAFSYEHLEDDRHLLVYDFGGGTFDVSIIEVFDGVVQVLSSAGDNALGGADFDAKIIEFIEHTFEVENGYAMKTITNDEKMLEYSLKQVAEDVKKQLSTQLEATIALPFVGLKDNFPVSFHTSLSRAQFEQMIAPLIDRTVLLVEQAMREANLTFRDISEVLMVGGSTRVPLIRSRMNELVGESKVRTDVHPDEVVAQGAAIQGALKSGSIAVGTEFMAIDVCPYTLGIETNDIEKKEYDIFDPLIKKNTPIPARKTSRYVTMEDNQTEMWLPIYQGENYYTKDNVLVSDQLRVKNIPPRPAFEESVDVIFEYDINGMIRVTAVLNSTGEVFEEVIESQHGVMDDEEKSFAIQRMEKEEENALLLEHVKQGIYRARKLQPTLSERDALQVEQYIDRAERAIQTGNEEELRAADRQLIEFILEQID